jgi:hypothetical protein
MIFGTLGRCGQCYAEKGPLIQNQAMRNIAVLTPIPPDGFRLPLAQQMNVIGHQVLGMKLERGAILLPSQQTQELSMIAFRMAYGLRVVPPRDQVVQPTLKF